MPRKRTDDDIQARLDRAEERVKRANDELRAAKKEAATTKRKHDAHRKIVGASTIEKLVGRTLDDKEWELVGKAASYLLDMDAGDEVDITCIIHADNSVPLFIYNVRHPFDDVPFAPDEVVLPGEVEVEIPALNEILAENS